MTGHGEKLSRKQEQAIGALLTEPTISAAAAAVGIGEATLRRWMKLDDFTTEYRAARRQVVEQATARLQQASSGAVDTLVKSLEADSESVQLRAAMAILADATSAVELLDLEERLAALERSTGK
jgi:transposase-like protein